MSRTYKDEVRQNYDRNKGSPYWKYNWWVRHGHKRSAAKIRRIYNRLDRHRTKDAMRRGDDPPRFRRYLKWIYW